MLALGVLALGAQATRGRAHGAHGRGAAERAGHGRPGRGLGVPSAQAGPGWGFVHSDSVLDPV